MSGVGSGRRNTTSAEEVRGSGSWPRQTWNPIRSSRRSNAIPTFYREFDATLT